MNLKLTNIGKISYADIELNSITVIAGENNTGKSTVGKMLYCVFHAFYAIDDQVAAERAGAVARILRMYLHELNIGKPALWNAVNEFAKDIVGRKDQILADRAVIVREIEELALGREPRPEQHIAREILEPTSSRIYDYLKIEDADLRKVILRKRLEAEFAMKIGHLNHMDKRSDVEVRMKDKKIAFTVANNENIDIMNYISLNKEIIYMDDPFILDDINDSVWEPVYDEFSHRYDMLTKLKRGKSKSEFTMADELVVKDKLAKIFDIMSDVCSGSVTMGENGEFIYQTDRLRGNLDMVNLSTGMKSFEILKRLLENGSIDENGVVILDEPEIHLHPEWQLRFAEMIVLLQKEFSLNILLNTHSPYFLNALEVYSKKYGIDEGCRYYLANETDGSTVLKDVTDNTEEIYAKLARPLQELENLEYSNESTIR